MNSKTIITCIFFIAVSMQIEAQNKHTGIPPEVSPMPMKPEMTEIWEPEVSVVTPAKTLGDAPSDAIILFDGTNLDQWVSQKDNTLAAPCKYWIPITTAPIEMDGQVVFIKITLHWSTPCAVLWNGTLMT